MNNKQNEKLCKLLGIYAHFCTEGEQPYTTDDKICEICDSNYKECWSRQKHYPDLFEPSNFIKLLEILTQNDLNINFGTCANNSKNYYSDIYNYDTMTNKGDCIDDLVELFCHIGETPQGALVGTLIEMFNGDLPVIEINCKMQEDLYCCWENGICIDYQRVVDKIHEILDKIKLQVQQTQWDY